MEKHQQLYSGKAKSLYQTDDPERLIVCFRNDTSAFDGKKVAQLENKGKINNIFNAFIMRKLQLAGIETHFEAILAESESIVKKLTMIPLECVVRNIAAGSLCRRIGIEEGIDLAPPIFEFFLKDDSLGDPLVNDYHIQSFGWATKQQVATMKELTFAINTVLQPLFLEGDMLLVDYKLEFGLFHDKLILGDEFSPDGCRVWDKQTREKLDKDRFRQDLGHVVDSYKTIGKRLGLDFDHFSP